MLNSFDARPLPTTILAVEAYLRACANPTELAAMEATDGGAWPYLYGMATVKLAEANSEILRLQRRITELEAEHATV